MLGHRIGRYILESELGSGAFATVYLGVQENVGTRVAIKVLHPEVNSDPDAVRRFFNEARAVARSKHPGIVQITDVGTHTNGRHFLVMEWLDGKTLEEVVDGHRVEAAAAVELCRQAALALAAAHDVDVIHRDIKPANMFVLPDEAARGGLRLKILDFGIARMTGTLGAGLSTPGRGMGTPLYMAPEQWVSSSNVDGRADIYSLGCVLYEVLVGAPPYEPTSLPEAMRMHASAPVPSVRAKRGDVPAELDRLVTRLLAKRVEDRPGSMRELVSLLAAAGTPSARRVAVEPPDVSQQDLSGQRIGSYILDKQLTTGSRATRYRGKHAALGSLVTIEILNAAASTLAASRHSFVSQPRIMTAVSHPGIPLVLDVGERDDGRPYVVTEWLNGASFEDRFATGPLDPREVIGLCRQAALVLAAVHGAGFVHRKVTPAALFIVRDDALSAVGRVKLIGFSIAAQSGEHQGSGTPEGVPFYMAPELWNPPSEIESSADVYALGCVAFQMLTGKPPYEGTSAAEVRDKHFREPVPSPRAQRQSVPVGLSALIRQMMDKHVSERPAMADVALELAILADETTTSRAQAEPPAPSRPQSRPPPRPPTPPVSPTAATHSVLDPEHFDRDDPTLVADTFMGKGHDEPPSRDTLQDLLRGTTYAASAPPVSSAPRAPVERVDRSPPSLPDYRIVSTLDPIWVGRRFAAVHTPSNSQVVLQELSSSHLTTRFNRDRIAYQSFRHRGVQETRAFEIDALSRSYWICEAVAGMTLATQIQNQAISLPDALDLVRQAAVALVALHRAGLVHGDLNPETIKLVIRSESPGLVRVKLCSVGLGALTRPPEDSALHWETSAEYMAPERWRGTVDGPADVYALGCIAFELVTGNPPFTGTHVELLKAHSQADVPALTTSVPALEKLIRRMLMKAIESRPSPSQIADELAIISNQLDIDA